MEKPEHLCRVCGYDHGYAPWGEDGKTPDAGCCPCCGAESGYDDDTVEAVRDYRATWIKRGARWWTAKLKPEGWDQQKQLAMVPKKWL